MSEPDDAEQELASWDHTRLAHLPEYARLARTMNELIEAIHREDIDLSQSDWLRRVLEVANALPYADGCRQCMAGENDPDMTFGWAATPYVGDVVDGWLRGRYRCPRHHAEWSCGHAVDIWKYL